MLNPLDSRRGHTLLSDLPPELLSHVFLSYLDILSPRNARIGLYVLGLTCKHWRQIIYGTAELWTYVGVRVKSTSDRSLINAVETWLKRSRQHPLKISFVIEGYSRLLDPSYKRLVEPVLSVLCQEMHRWSSASFSFGFYSLTHKPTSEERTSAPILQSLEINMAGYISINYAWIIQIMRRSPNLRSFVGDILPREASVTETNPNPLSQLSFIDINGDLSTSLALSVIGLMPLLETCRINLESDPPDQPPQFVTCHAYELKIGFRESCSRFLDSILAPNLQKFELHFLLHKLIPTSQENPIHEFLRKTSATLSSFTIRNLFMTDSDLLNCLRILSPRLKALHILADKLWPLEYYEVENFTDLVISALHYDAGQPSGDVCCPQLEVLTLHRCISSEDGLLSKMIASRWNNYVSQTLSLRSGWRREEITHHLSGLYFFDVVFRYHENLEDCRVLEELRQQGLGGQTRRGYP